MVFWQWLVSAIRLWGSQKISIKHDPQHTISIRDIQLQSRSAGKFRNFYISRVGVLPYRCKLMLQLTETGGLVHKFELCYQNRVFECSICWFFNMTDMKRMECYTRLTYLCWPEVLGRDYSLLLILVMKLWIYLYGKFKAILNYKWTEQL